MSHADSVVDLAAGDVFKFGAEFGSNDAAKGSVNGGYVAWRNLCLNLIIIGEGRSDKEFSFSHRGGMDGIAEAVAAMAGNLGTVRDSFAADWGLTRSTKVEAVMPGYGGVEACSRRWPQARPRRTWAETPPCDSSGSVSSCV